MDEELLEALCSRAQVLGDPVDHRDALGAQRPNLLHLGECPEGEDEPLLAVDEGGRPNETVHQHSGVALPELPGEQQNHLVPGGVLGPRDEDLGDEDLGVHSRSCS